MLNAWQKVYNPLWHRLCGIAIMPILRRILYFCTVIVAVFRTLWDRFRLEEPLGPVRGDLKVFPQGSMWRSSKRGPGHASTINGRGREARKNGPYALNAPWASHPGHCGSPVLSTAAAHPEGGRGRVGAYAGPLRQERYAVTAVLPRGRLQCACRCASRKSLIVGPAARR